MSETLTEGRCVESSDTKEDELQDVTVRTEDGVPSVEVTLSFDDEDEDYDEDDYNTDVTQRQSVIKKSFRCPVCGLSFDTFFKLKRHRVSGCSEDSIKENTITTVNVNSVIYTRPGDRRKEKQTKARCSIGSEQVNPEPSHNTSICSEDESWSPDSLQQSRSSDTSGRQMCKRSSRIKTCSICGQAFTSSADLTSHARAHSEGDSHICGKCGTAFDTYEKLKSHQENGCKERTDSLMNVKNIQEIQREQKDITKCIVLLRRMSPNRAREFLSNHSIKTEAPVIDCDVIKPCSINSLAGATQTNTETDSDPQIIQSEPENGTSTKKSIKCTLCDQTFSELDLMQRHYFKSHVVNGTVQCSACKRDFVRLCDIVRHHQKRLYQCATCKKCFTKPALLKKHKSTFNDTCRIPHINEKKIGKSCIIARSLEEHKNTQPIVCSYCDKKFCSIYTLRVHMYKHTGGFSCPICAKVFHQKIYLTRHIDRHNGQEPYLCEICGQGWPTQRYLDSHMIKHTDERPFKCDQCDKTFKRVNVLRLHIRSKHLDLRPYVCRVCGKAHRFSRDLKEHMIKHTGVYPHNCSRCGKGFGRLYYLKKHQQTKCK